MIPWMKQRKVEELYNEAEIHSISKSKGDIADIGMFSDNTKITVYEFEKCTLPFSHCLLPFAHYLLAFAYCLDKADICHIRKTLVVACCCFL